MSNPGLELVILLPQPLGDAPPVARWGCKNRIPGRLGTVLLSHYHQPRKQCLQRIPVSRDLCRLRWTIVKEDCTCMEPPGDCSPPIKGPWQTPQERGRSSWWVLRNTVSSVERQALVSFFLSFFYTVSGVWQSPGPVISYLYFTEGWIELRWAWLVQLKTSKLFIHKSGA